MVVKKCNICGKLFVGRSRTAKFCSDDHYAPCPVCGKLKKLTYDDLLRGPGNHTSCSNECKRVLISRTQKSNSLPKLYICYLIENTLNNRRYVGITSRSINTRWAEHKHIAKLPIEKRNSHSELYDDLAKYGESPFQVYLIESNISEALRDSKEQYYIEFYDANISKGGYNLNSGGIEGSELSDISRSRMSEVHQGHTMSEEQKSLLHIIFSGSGNPMYGLLGSNHPAYGKHRTEEQKLKVSGINSPLYGKNGEAHPAYGHKWSEERKLIYSHRLSGPGNPMYGKHGKDNPNYGSGRPVNMYKRNSSDILNTFSNTREAAEWIRANIKPGKVTTAYTEIRKALVGIRPTAYNYVWSYADTLNN